MTTSEPTDTASDASKPARGWVWHSTDASIAAGQISVLSVVETFCALGLYGWLAFHFEHQWWLLISAVAAPIILLRSPESEKLGVEWLQTYVATDDKEWKDFSLTKKSILIVIPIVISWLLTWALSQVWIVESSDGNLSLRFIILCMLAITIMGVIPRAIAFEISGTGFVARQVAHFGMTIIQGLTISIGFGTGMMAIIELIIIIKLGIDIPKILFLTSIIIFGYAVVRNGNKFTLSIKVLVISSFLASGIWLRSLLIRIFSTLCHFYSGWIYLPSNWQTNLWMVDFTHPPELLPGATQVDILFSVSGLLEEMQTKTGQIWWINAILVVCWYIPALMWRWSLKATLWLWFPLALLLRPDKATDNVGKVRKEAVTQIWVSGLLLWVAIITALWLGTGHFSSETVQSWAELAGENTGKWLEKLLALATPPTGLIEATLWLCCGMVGLVWLYSQYVQKQTPETFANEGSIYEMHPEPKQLFLANSQWLARLYTFLVVSFILLGYSFALHLANQWYPQELARFFPASLIGWL